MANNYDTSGRLPRMANAPNVGAAPSSPNLGGLKIMLTQEIRPQSVRDSLQNSQEDGSVHALHREASGNRLGDVMEALDGLQIGHAAKRGLQRRLTKRGSLVDILERATGDWQLQ